MAWPAEMLETVRASGTRAATCGGRYGTPASAKLFAVMNR